MDNLRALVLDELKRYEQLIQLERSEEIHLYRQMRLLQSIQERKKNGTTWYPVQLINEEIGLGEKLIIEVQRSAGSAENHSFQQGQTVSLFVQMQQQVNDKNVLNATVIWVREHTMRLSVGIDMLPEWLYEGKLGVDMLYNETTFKEMAFALERLMKTEQGRLRELCEVLLGYRAARFERSVVAPLYPNLNSMQQQAVQRVGESLDLAIVHGPPGTGKTTTLVQAICYTLQQEEQVLVATASNTAVDLLCEKLVSAGVHVLRLGHPARINENLIEQTLEGQMAMHTDYKRLQQFRKEAHQYRREAMKYKRHFGEEQRYERKQLLEQAKLLIDHAKMTERYIVEHLIERAQVICCTLVGAANMELKGRMFGTVFIDEASQAMLPATFIPILKAKRVVFAGDHCQLPPTVKSMEAVQKGLAVSLFERCIEQQKAATVMLEKQYRMNEQIMLFSSREFYGGLLQADVQVSKHVLGKQMEQTILGSALDFIDTAGTGMEEALVANSMSICNTGEAKLLLDYLSLVYERLEVEQPQQVWEYTVGVISPYKEQVNLLRKMLKDYPLLVRYGTQISVNTVDGFQGQERDIIAMSLVRSNERSEIGFLKDLRRMNVALTRARKKLIIVGDSATLGGYAFYERFLEYVMSIEGAYKSAWEFMADSF